MLIVFLIVFIIGLFFSVLITTSLTEVCDPGKGCDVVNHSKYGSVFGIKNSTYGIYIFSFFILLTLYQLVRPTRLTMQVLNLGIVLGSLVAIYFIYLQAFVLNAWCKYCLVIDIALIIGLLAFIFSCRKP